MVKRVEGRDVIPDAFNKAAYTPYCLWIRTYPAGCDVNAQLELFKLCRIMENEGRSAEEIWAEKFREKSYVRSNIT